MRDPFWQSSLVMLRYKRQLMLAAVGVGVTSLCFASGLGMILPTLQLLLGERQPLQVLIQKHLGTPDNPESVQQAAAWLIEHLPTDAYANFVLVMGIIMALTVVGNCGRYLYEIQTLTVMAKAVMHWRTKLMRRLIQSQLQHMSITGHADYIARITNDVGLLGRGYRAVLSKAVVKSMEGLVAMGVALWLDWRLTLIAMIGAPVVAVVLRKLGKKVRRASKRMMVQQGKMIALLHESLGGLRVVKLHLAEGYERRRFRRLNRALYHEEMRLRRVRGLLSPLIETLGMIGVLSVACIAAWYVLKLDVEPERFMTVLAALAVIAASLKPVASLHNQLQEASAAAVRVMDTLQTPVEPIHPRADPPPPSLPRHRQAIVFERVSYTYPNKNQPAVDQVSLRVAFGQTVAVVGSNGSGKTSLLSLLPRLISPSNGRVLVDGVDIAGVDLKSLRKQIAVVPQQTNLFEGTIAQNIAYGRGHEPRPKVITAAKAAFADEFIVDLPQGYDTMLSEGGEGLSGGQKQRISIARAVLRNPAILILDEATSQIDADSETRINQALHEIRHHRTTFVIAHRLSTVVDADLIVVMDAGRIIDQGTHAELLDRCRVYQTLTQTQLQPASA